MTNSSGFWGSNFIGWLCFKFVQKIGYLVSSEKKIKFPRFGIHRKATDEESSHLKKIVKTWKKLERFTLDDVWRNLF